MIMADDKNAALLSQRSAFSRELSDRMGHMVQQHTQQVGSAVDALHKADVNIKSMRTQFINWFLNRDFCFQKLNKLLNFWLMCFAEREEAVLHGAKLLAISRSCDNLMRSLGINPFPTKDWTHQRRSIDGHVRDVEKVFEGKKDEFVSTTLKMLPEKAVRLNFHPTDSVLMLNLRSKMEY